MPHDEFVQEDPMGLVGIVLPGEPGQLEAMAECFVEEYVRMGWDERRLMTLFVNPTFLAAHRIYRSKGEQYVRDLIRKTCVKWSVLRVPCSVEGEDPRRNTQYETRQGVPHA